MIQSPSGQKPSCWSLFRALQMKVTDVECICEGISDLRALRYMVIDRKVATRSLATSGWFSCLQTLWGSVFVTWAKCTASPLVCSKGSFTYCAKRRPQEKPPPSLCVRQIIEKKVAGTTKT
eukprot:3425568-Amphidinium_carterae.1